MSLQYLIDGYNLLYALAVMPAGTWEFKREALVRRIAQERPQGRNHLTVVFDSREGAGSQTRRGELTLVYTAGETADDWISRRVRAAANPRIFVVVTNDQGLRRLIRGTGAKWRSVDDFWRQGKARPGDSTQSTRHINAESITEEFKQKWDV